MRTRSLLAACMAALVLSGQAPAEVEPAEPGPTGAEAWWAFDQAVLESMVSAEPAFTTCWEGLPDEPGPFGIQLVFELGADGAPGDLELVAGDLRGGRPTRERALPALESCVADHVRALRPGAPPQDAPSFHYTWWVGFGRTAGGPEVVVVPMMWPDGSSAEAGQWRAPAEPQPVPEQREEVELDIDWGDDEAPAGDAVSGALPWSPDAARGQRPFNLYGRHVHAVVHAAAPDLLGCLPTRGSGTTAEVRGYLEPAAGSLELDLYENRVAPDARPCVRQALNTLAFAAPIPEWIPGELAIDFFALDGDAVEHSWRWLQLLRREPPGPADEVLAGLEEKLRRCYRPDLEEPLTRWDVTVRAGYSLPEQGPVEVKLLYREESGPDPERSAEVPGDVERCLLAHLRSVHFVPMPQSAELVATWQFEAGLAGSGRREFQLDEEGPRVERVDEREVEVLKRAEQEERPADPDLRDGIDRVIKANLTGIEACYRSGLARNPRLGGRLVMELLIDTEGRTMSVAPVHHRTTLQDAAVVRCVSAELASLRYPTPPSGLLRIRYPLAFNRQPAR